MPVIEKIAYPVMQKLVCEKCDTELKIHDIDTDTYQYCYKCEKCGYEERSYVLYPKTIFVEGTLIETTGLSWRSCEAIKEHGIKTVEDLVRNINYIDSLPEIVKSEAIQMLSERGLIPNEQQRTE
jgi:hypothetical protein